MNTKIEDVIYEQISNISVENFESYSKFKKVRDNCVKSCFCLFLLYSFAYYTATQNYYSILTNIGILV